MELVDKEKLIKKAHNIVVPMVNGGTYRHRCIDIEQIREAPVVTVKDIVDEMPDYILRALRDCIDEKLEKKAWVILDSKEGETK